MGKEMSIPPHTHSPYPPQSLGLEEHAYSN